jgi:tRNA-binding protein
MEEKISNKLTWDDFTKVEMRIGTILEAEVFQEARNPAYKMIIDFGPVGNRKTSAQITDLYNPEELVGKQVVAVVNFPPKQIANIMSECLVLGGIGKNNEITLLQPERNIENGTRIG